MSKSIKHTALSYLARRDHSQQELLTKLKQKGFTASDIEPVLQELVQKKLQSDGRFAENYAYSRRRKGFGPLRIILELQNKGLSTEMIAEVIHIADNEWFIAAKAVWDKHFSGARAKDFKEKARQMRFLQYKGYTQEQIEFAIESTIS